MVKKSNIFVFLLVCFILIPTISAETSFFVKQNTNHNIIFSCDMNGGVCPNNVFCPLTITRANGTDLITSQNASNAGNGNYNYTLNVSETFTKGEYTTRVSCIDPLGRTANDTSTFIYEVNPTGIRPNDQRTDAISRGIIFNFLIGLLLFVTFFFTKQKTPVKWTIFIFAIIFLLISLNLLFVDLQDQVVNPALESFFDGFIAISWIFYWFCAGLLIIIWMLTFIQTWFFKKNLAILKKYGIN